MFLWLPLLLVGLVIAGGWAIQKPAVQKFLAKKATAYLADKMNTQIQVGGVYVDVWRRILLEEVYIEDWDCDTLLYAKRLKVDINGWQLLNKAVQIDGVELQNAYVRLYRGSELKDKFNFKYPLDELITPKPKEDKPSETSKPWCFDLNYLTLDNIRFELIDKQENTDVAVKLAHFQADFDNFDIVEHRMELNKLLIAQPVIAYTQIPQPDEIIAVTFGNNVIGQIETNADSTVINLGATLDDLSPEPWFVSVTDFQLIDGTFAMTNGENIPDTPGAMNFKKLRVKQIQIDVDHLVFENDTITTHINQLTANEQSGFALQHLEGDLLFAPTQIELKDFLLKTKNSQLGPYLSFEYETLNDFEDFINKVKLDTQFEDAYFTFKDITYFAPKLAKTAFIKDHLNTKIRIDGHVSQPIRKIKGEEVVLRMGNTYLKGDFRLRGLPKFSSTNIDFKVARLTTNMDEIKWLLKDVKLPPNVEKLGNLDFTGRFTGFPTNFVADGTLNTDIGSVHTDLKMEFGDIAQYSGDLAVKDFDLGKWVDQPDKLGKLSFSANVEGSGLKIEELHANIKGKVQSITFNNYTYNNISIDGEVDKKLFAGNVGINDQNLNMNFRGEVNLNERVPKLDFTANIIKANLHRLGLLKPDEKGDLIIAGHTQLDLTGDNIDNITGNVLLKNVSIQQGKKTFNFDEITAASFFKDRERSLQLRSDILTGDVVGTFSFDVIGNAFVNYLNYYLPYRFKKVATTAPQDIRFDIEIKDPSTLTSQLLPKLQNITEGHIEGNFNSGTKILNLDIDIPFAQYDSITFNNLKVAAHSDHRGIQFNGQLKELMTKDSIVISQLGVGGEIHNDSIDFKIKVADEAAPTRARVNGLLFANTDTLKLQLDSTELVYENEPWKATTGMFIYKNKDYFEIEDIILEYQEASKDTVQRITLRSHPSKNYKNYTQVFLDSIDLANPLIYRFVKAIRQTEMKGLVSGQIAIKDVFEQQIIAAELNVNEYVFKDQIIGSPKIYVKKEKENDTIALNVKVRPTPAFTNFPEYDFEGKGFLKLPSREGEKPHLDITGVFDTIPMRFLEAFLTGMISETEGYGIGKLRFHGDAQQPNIDGNILIQHGKTKIDLLNTKYSFHDQMLKFNKKHIRFVDAIMNDRDRNTANVNAALFLNDYKNLSLDAFIQSDNFLFMDTKYADNEAFYGKAYGKGHITFNGPINQMEMYVNATSQKNTQIFLPVSDAGGVAEGQFFKFINTGVDAPKNKDTNTDDDEANEASLSGMNMRFDINLTPDADMQLIFDLQAGDIIKGRGHGDLQMFVSTIGGDMVFNMYGTYNITEGDYLFTLQNVINKHFDVEKGGSVHFAGDPYAAQLDVKAIYQAKAARYDFFSEEEKAAMTPEEEKDLKRQIPVNVLLHLTGSIVKPGIAFEIDFPNEETTRAGDLVQTKLNEIARTDINELNKQIFGLLILNSFMPPEKFELDFRTGGITTVSELLSNYVSSYLNEAISSIIPDSEFNLKWRNYEAETGSLEAFRRNEIEVEFEKRLFDNRLSISIGGNFDLGEQVGSTDEVYIAGDFVVEYMLSPDGKYRLRIYNRFDDDIFTGEYNKTGISFFITQEFDTFKEWFKSRKNKKTEETKPAPALETPPELLKEQPSTLPEDEESRKN